MNEDINTSNPTKRKLWVMMAVGVSIAVLLSVLFGMLPKGFKTTHEQIGNGKPAVVFVYDPGLAISNPQTEQMNQARETLGNNAHFLLAREGTPEGDQFLAKHRAQSAEIFVFSAAGELIKRQYAVAGANELVQLLMN
ncbi:hypothetical protein ACFOD0_11655 [Shewanella intestini]|uniref:DUF4358 domain-containing protein n=1 Tax=Shewanella intestini TaxID=2017544 RepID=A0ABS5I336_9GAMM|nr:MULTISPECIES: hypothetical protein [Shewanella]MBR9728438.1 hypothetical protein [Shewanella intestini]MRG36780.1 hypothetical protein [Shewanella sp. XMDDZSB0408]